MNSQQIIKENQEYYQEIFSKCPIVISAPRAFPFTFESLHEQGVLSISQKIPLRTYVGIEESSDRGINFSCYLEYEPCEKAFNKKILHDHIIKRIIDIIQTNFPLFKTKGISIHYLMELPINRAMGGYSTLCLCLAAAIMTYAGYFKNHEFDKICNLNLKDILSNTKIFDLFQLAYKFNLAINSRKNISGSGILHSLVYSKSPTIFIRDNSKKSNNIRNIEKDDFSAMKLLELISDNHIAPAPLDYALIYSGSMMSFFNKVTPYDYPDKIALYEILNSCKINDVAQALNADCFKNNDIREQYINAAVSITLETLYALKMITGKDLNEKNLDYLLSIINKNYSIAQIFNLSNPRIDYIISYIRNEADRIGVNLGIKSTSRKKADILVSFYQDEFRNKIEQVISWLKSNTSENICIDYLSWEDGYETEGIRVEQNLGEGIYSKFISKDAIAVREYENHECTKKIISKEEMEKEKKNIDLLVDLKNKDIYIKNSKLTSKDIHSSSTTVEILKILLENHGKCISNKVLPESSYTFERGELQSKIISPLVKAVKKYAGKDLDLKITGSLSNFNVCLNINDLIITVSEKII